MSYIRVSLQGTLPGGESWSVNPTFNETTNVVDWDQSEGQSAADAIGALDVPTALNDARSGAAQYARARVERRTDAGLLLGAAEANWTGGGASSVTPRQTFQTSVVLSLRTPVPGASFRGRLYWPALGTQVDATTLRLSVPTAQAVATAAATYLDGIASALKNALAASPSLIDYDLCVRSAKTGTRTRVTRVEVGNILDVQRRRRDKALEQYFAAPMP